MLKNDYFPKIATEVMSKPFINLSEIKLETQQHGDNFFAQMGSIANLLGGEKLGCRLTVLPPGKKAFPYHCHHVNEEMFIIWEGKGSLRFGENIYEVKKGDVIITPAGGKHTAHQLINTSDADLVYLAISTKEEPDVMEYPDSGKFGVLVGAAPGGDKTKRRFTFFGHQDSQVDYWEGES